MKNIIKICVFTFIFMLGSQVANAQSTAKQDAMAQTKKLKELTKFESDKFKPVYNAYLNYNRKLESINKHIDPETISYMEATDKLKVKFSEQMEGILNKEEYAIFAKREKL